MLIRVISDLKPTYLAVAFDRPEPTFRQELFADYQAQRPKMEDELGEQFGIVKEVLGVMGIAMFEMPGYEADDVIGSLAFQAMNLKIKNKRAKSKNTDQKLKLDEVIIVTGDRDMLQLVDKSIKLYMPIKGLTEAKLYDETAVKEKFGIAPEQMVDYKALVGDASDNYPGVAGIGPKTAVDLLVSYKSLDGVYKHLDSINKDSLKEKLIAGEKDAEMAKKLATIVTDAPVEVEIDQCRLPQLNSPEIEECFQKLGFKSLISRLKGNKPQVKSEETKNEQLTLV